MRSASDRQSTLIASLGATAIVASLIFGIGGLAMVTTMTSGLSTTIHSSAAVVNDVAIVTEAAALNFNSVREVVGNIETAARSGARTLRTVEGLLAEIGEQAAQDVAASLESAVDAMPGIIRTGRVVDRTLNALSFVGVDYDPEVPLDEALESLEQSLAPLPGEIREQAGLLEEATADIADMSESSSSLAASLLEVRIELLEAEGLVAEAALNVEEVSTRFEALEDDFASYATWLPWLVVAAAVALAAVGAGLLLVGLRGAPEPSPQTHQQ